MTFIKIVRALKWKFGLLDVARDHQESVKSEVENSWSHLFEWLRASKDQRNDLIERLSAGTKRDYDKELIEYKLDLAAVSRKVAHLKKNSYESDWGPFLKTHKPRLIINIDEVSRWLSSEMANRNSSSANKTVNISLQNEKVDGLAGATAQVEEQAPVQQPTAPQWKYLPVPDGLDKHEEYASRIIRLPEGFNLIGARVRGKKHKHEGTNCDDWFEFDAVGPCPWTIIAVSDGAGSKKLSRIGSKVACEAVLRHLSNSLKDHTLTQRDKWDENTFRRATSGIFGEADIEFVQTSLHGAMNAAYEALEKKAAELHNSKDYFEYLDNRKPDIKDLSATLLVAVHSTVNYNGRAYSFILTCQIGDGMIAAIDHVGTLQLLAVPDSGEFSGETEFLTSKKKLTPANLIGKTVPFFRPLKALFVMTDGVADDYFPNDPGMSRLYGDHVLNRVINVAEPDKDSLASALASTKLNAIEDVQRADFSDLVERVVAVDPRPKVRIKSVQKYAEALSKPLQEVLASPPLLWAGSSGDAQDGVGSAEVGLQVWLDTYYNRGSFDDRTLVILYPEHAS